MSYIVFEFFENPPTLSGSASAVASAQASATGALRLSGAVAAATALQASGSTAFRMTGTGAASVAVQAVGVGSGGVVYIPPTSRALRIARGSGLKPRVVSVPLP